MTRPDLQDVARNAELLAAIRTAIETTRASDLVDSLITFQATAPRYNLRNADIALRNLLRATPAQFRDRAVGELMTRATGHDAPTVLALGPVLCLIVDHWHPGRRELLADLQLSILRPALLRDRLRESWLADAAAMDTARTRAVHGAKGACAALVAQLDDGERRAVARWVVALDGALGDADLCLARARDDSLGESLVRRRLNWSAEEIAELLRSARFTYPDGTLTLQGVELRFALPAAERLPDTDLSVLLPELHTIVDDLDSGRRTIGYDAPATAPRRLHALLDRATPAPGRPAPPPPFRTA